MKDELETVTQAYQFAYSGISKNKNLIEKLCENEMRRILEMNGETVNGIVVDKVSVDGTQVTLHGVVARTVWHDLTFKEVEG